MTSTETLVQLLSAVLPKEKIYVNMDRFGNISSASVPICLNEMRKNGLLHEGQTIVCTGFGGGLTYGAFVLNCNYSTIFNRNVRYQIFSAITFGYIS